MTTGELLEIEPEELQFPFELKKQISCSMQLINRSEKYVAFKVKTTNPKKYCVRPNTGVVLPRSTADVIGVDTFSMPMQHDSRCRLGDVVEAVHCCKSGPQARGVTMQAQKEAPPDMQCKDKFLVQSVVINEGTSAKDLPPNLFNKEEDHNVEECKLKVTYVAPPQPPSPVREGSEEGSSPRASVSDNGTVNASEFTTVAKSLEPQPLRSQAEPQSLRPRIDLQESSTEAKGLISKLTEERNFAIQQRNKVQQELEFLRRGSNVNRGGIPFLYVIIVGVLGLFLGYLLKRT